MKKNWSGKVLSGLAAVAVLAGGAFAQSQAPAPVKIEPPELRFTTKDQGVGFLSILGMLLVLILVIGVNFIPTKRGHQD